jgi:hypothetical protein
MALVVGLAAVTLPFKQPIVDYKSYINPEDATEFDKQQINAFTEEKKKNPSIRIPGDYSQEENVGSKIKRGLSFTGQRLGVTAGTGIDRLLFKNQNYLRFIRKDWLFNKGYFGNDREYRQLIGENVFDLGTTVKLTLSPNQTFTCRINKEIIEKDTGLKYYWVEYKTREGDNKVNLLNTLMGRGGAPVQASVRNTKPEPLITIIDDESEGFDKGEIDGSYFKVYDYPVLEEMLVSANKSSQNFYFKLNEEKNPPFANENLFNFLHMFKYSFNKALLYCRVNWPHHIIKELLAALNETPYITEADSPEEYNKLTEFTSNEKYTLENTRGINDDGRQNRNKYLASYLFAYRKFMTIEMQGLAKSLKFGMKDGAGDIGKALSRAKDALSAPAEVQQKIIDSNDSTAEKQGANFGSGKEETNPDMKEVMAETLDTNPTPETEQAQGTSTGGRKHKYTRRAGKKIHTNKKQSRRMYGGALDSPTILNKLTKYIYTRNITDKQPLSKVLTYAGEEQRRFIGLALQIYETGVESARIQAKDLSTKSFSFTEENSVSSDVDAYLNNKHSGKDIETLISDLANKMSTAQAGGLSMPNLGIKSTLTNGRSYVANRTLNRDDDIALNQIFNYSYKRMVNDRLRKIFEWRIRKKELTEEQKAEVTENGGDIVHVETFKKHRETVNEFLKEFSWSIIMSAHFTCSTATNLALAWFNPLTVIPGMPPQLTALISPVTPQCFISGIMFTSLLFKLKPISANILLGYDDIEKKLENPSAFTKSVASETGVGETVVSEPAVSETVASKPAASEPAAKKKGYFW